MKRLNSCSEVTLPNESKAEMTIYKLTCIKFNALLRINLGYEDKKKLRQNSRINMVLHVDFS